MVLKALQLRKNDLFLVRRPTGLERKRLACRTEGMLPLNASGTLALQSALRSAGALQKGDRFLRS